MFGIFRDPKAKLEAQYQRLLKEAYRLSHTDRKQSDLKVAEADEIRKKLETLDESK
jgi:hypothetical protein